MACIKTISETRSTRPHSPGRSASQISSCPNPNPRSAETLLQPKGCCPSGSKVDTGQGLYDSGVLDPRHGHNVYALTFTKPGTFVYWCVVHVPEGMKGTVVVKEKRRVGYCRGTMSRLRSLPTDDQGLRTQGPEAPS